MKENELNLINKYRTAIMGFAALWIFLFHEQEHEWVKVFFSPEWLSRTLYFVKRIGFSGVDIFLLLSGIGLVYSIEKHSIRSFYKRRLKRVFIPFFLFGIIRMFVDNWSIKTFIRKVFFYDFLFVYINSFLWFIPVILILYFCFPLYYRFFEKARNKIFFTLCAYAVWLIFSLLCKNILRGDLYTFTNRIPIFLTGILAAWLIREKNFKFTKPIWFLFFAIFLTGMVLAYYTCYRELYLLVPISNCCIPTFLLAISCTMLISKLFSFMDSFATGKGFLKILSFFGKISLEIYIVQEWLDDIIRPRIIIHHDIWMNYFVFINLAIAICVFIAALILYYFSNRLGKLIGGKSFKTRG